MVGHTLLALGTLVVLAYFAAMFYWLFVKGWHP